MRTNKLFIAAELTIAVLIMLGNAVGLIPYTSVPILLVFIWLSLRLRGTGWRGVGLARPEHFGRTLTLGMLIGIVYPVLSLFLIEPVITRLAGSLPDASEFAPVVGSVGYLLAYLAMSWTLAALSEEIIYRGYLMNRIADMFDSTNMGRAVSLLVSSIAFGAVHSYQGAAGVIATSLSGLLFGTIYLASGRNLWLPIVAHGRVKPVALGLIFLGQYPGL